jgi:hypothetical protein
MTTVQNPMDSIKIIKMVPGTLVLKFQNALDYSNVRTIAIEANMEFQRMPINYVVSMFQLQDTLGLYKAGFFTFSKEDKEKVFKYAEELQLYFPSGDVAEQVQPTVLYTDKQIVQALTMGRLKEIDEIILKGSRAQKQLLVDAAVANIDKLKISTLRYLEEKLGVQISEGDE